MEDFSVLNFKNYSREYKSYDLGLGRMSSAKTYEDYRMIDMVESANYKYIHNHCTVDESGMLVDEDGFVGVAMGYYFGDIGSRYYVILDTGNIIPVVKVDEKAAIHVPNGIAAAPNYDVIEFVIDTNRATDYFGRGPFGLVSSGNFNNHDCFKGHIVSIEKVSNEKLEEGVYYEDKLPLNIDDTFEDDGFVDVVGGY